MDGCKLKHTYRLLHTSAVFPYLTSVLPDTFILSAAHWAFCGNTS